MLMWWYGGTHTHFIQTQQGRRIMFEGVVLIEDNELDTDQRQFLVLTPGTRWDSHKVFGVSAAAYRNNPKKPLTRVFVHCDAISTTLPLHKLDRAGLSATVTALDPESALLATHLSETLLDCEVVALTATPKTPRGRRACTLRVPIEEITVTETGDDGKEEAEEEDEEEEKKEEEKKKKKKEKKKKKKKEKKKKQDKRDREFSQLRLENDKLKKAKTRENEAGTQRLNKQQGEATRLAERLAEEQGARQRAARLEIEKTKQQNIDLQKRLLQSQGSSPPEQLPDHSTDATEKMRLENDQLAAQLALQQQNRTLKQQLMQFQSGAGSLANMQQQNQAMKQPLIQSEPVQHGPPDNTAQHQAEEKTTIKELLARLQAMERSQLQLQQNQALPQQLTQSLSARQPQAGWPAATLQSQAQSLQRNRSPAILGLVRAQHDEQRRLELERQIQDAMQ
jgi:hypothetical protein